MRLEFSTTWPVAAVGVLGVGPALVLFLTCWQGCNIYNSSLLLEGGSEGGVVEASQSCLAKWPAVPAQDDPSSGGDYSGYFVMQTVDVGNSDAGVLLDSSAPLPPIGFDLDNDCTCCGGTTGTCKTGGSCVGPSIVCDDNAGRDHVALKIFSVIPNASASANAGMQAGQYSIVLQISGYNGKLNDTSVTVALYVSNGMDGIQDGGTVMPRHDGTDVWTVDTHYLATTLNGGNVPNGTPCNSTTACQPIFVDNGAYVTGGVLVARPSAKLPLTFGYRANIGGALMKLNDAVISGTLRSVKGAGGMTLWGIVNGSISGRWDSSELLSNLATLPYAGADGSYLCGTDPNAASFYSEAKVYICGLQDIMSSKASDNKMMPCNALSMSFGFTAEPALVGTVYSVSPPPSGCQTEAGLWSDTCQ